MMNTKTFTQDIERRAKALGIPMAELCRTSGIAVSTFNRWKAGTMGPTFAKAAQISEALDKAERRIQ